jgi:phosphomannomutase
MKKLFVFDLDGTLALSKLPIDSEMGGLLDRLLHLMKVCIISGGNWLQFEKQVLPRLSVKDGLANLSIMPVCGTQYYSYNLGWEKLYEEDFTAEERKLILGELGHAVAAEGLLPKKQWGELIEDRGSQITYSGLGQQAPLAEKKIWDLDFAKRKRLKAILDKRLAGFSVQIGGATSIDVTRKGIDKAYGIFKLREMLGIETSQMMFAGDALFEGGNDYPVRATGATCIQVRDPEETKRVIEAVLAVLS